MQRRWRINENLTCASHAQLDCWSTYIQSFKSLYAITMDADALTAMMLLPLLILREVVLYSIVPKEKLLNMNDVSITRLIAAARRVPI